LFYIPHYAGCLAWPVTGWAPFPSFNETGAASATAQTPSRSGHLTWYTLAAKRWVEREFPFWNRTGGVDHVMLFAHDEGSCAAPAEVRPATLLVHWGLQNPAHWCVTLRTGNAAVVDNAAAQTTNAPYHLLCRSSRMQSTATRIAMCVSVV
jgi:hypothetical protein